MAQEYPPLTEKEKQALRLIVRGYDAKSMTLHLGLSVHTINERLRHARRKMAVSSSREAARRLRDCEAGQGPHSSVHEEIGDAAGARVMADNVASARPETAPGKTGRALVWGAGGAVIMSLILATLLLATGTLVPAGGAAANTEANTEAMPDPASPVEASAVVAAARRWLALVDAGDWDASWNETGQSFKAQNTTARWAQASQGARVPLGRVLARVALSQESVPAPPYGYEMVTFRTHFSGREAAIEKLGLSHEGGTWKVVGYWIE
ncbi:DUF4019 domain-containing protein [Novosphingobium sp. 1949]|uniref:DUF4019 domain-containing protein n=1 Tax=Novosphingobium organovorum TaxID=2930092 RepID=A0ABT0BGX3_9SPHN|nr:DUF4019 domain-containing protein [Novosphingobium organovorum]MCJ2184303.1 DUF4019 domain-containing protein [Novosphingobium organovorum]